ncbi:jg16487 [Pararge aegeria aegeria]|uniref:Jg16487 protein n=1 Tax=Pararge aegeria aegeria TaxID=348720 RepID=A0A8S4RHN7_9NEOP|nr:jg16487 [Pararge aegeria aegeria]
MDLRVVLLVVGLAVVSSSSWDEDGDFMYPESKGMSWRFGCPPGYHEYNGICVVALIRGSFDGSKCPTGTVRVMGRCVEEH